VPEANGRAVVTNSDRPPRTVAEHPEAKPGEPEAEPEAIEAEVIVLEPLPRSQFRVTAAQVWGRSVSPYDPLRGWLPPLICLSRTGILTTRVLRLGGGSAS
jgi:hypothetical protein